MADKNDEKRREKVTNEVSLDRNRERSRSTAEDEHRKVFGWLLVITIALYNDFLYYQCVSNDAVQRRESRNCLVVYIVCLLQKSKRKTEKKKSRKRLHSESDTDR
jgi:hypothetical protein